MATKSIKWSTAQPLPCGDCVPANVVLCVKSELIDQSAFVDLGITKKTINAQLTESSKTTCSCPTYKYTFEYDDSQLADLETPLACADILGAFCKGCLVSWIQEQIAVAGSADDSEGIIVTSQGLSNQQTEFPITATASITNPSATHLMRVIGNIQFSGTFVTAATATGRSISRDFSVDASSPVGEEAIGIVPSATSSVMNTGFNWFEDLGNFTAIDDDLTLLDPGETKTYEVTFDGELDGGDTITAINCFLNLTGITYNP